MKYTQCLCHLTREMARMLLFSHSMLHTCHSALKCQGNFSKNVIPLRKFITICALSAPLGCTNVTKACNIIFLSIQANHHVLELHFQIGLSTLVDMNVVTMINIRASKQSYIPAKSLDDSFRFQESGQSKITVL
jgi:hypothetical protein